MLLNPVGTYCCYLAYILCEYWILHVCLCTCSYQPPVLMYQVIVFKEDKADIKQAVKAQLCSGGWQWTDLSHQHEQTVLLIFTSLLTALYEESRVISEMGSCFSNSSVTLRGLLFRGKVCKYTLGVQTAASCFVVGCPSVRYSCQIF